LGLHHLGCIPVEKIADHEKVTNGEIPGLYLCRYQGRPLFLSERGKPVGNSATDPEGGPRAFVSLSSEGEGCPRAHLRHTPREGITGEADSWETSFLNSRYHFGGARLASRWGFRSLFCTKGGLLHWGTSVRLRLESLPIEEW